MGRVREDAEPAFHVQQTVPVPAHRDGGRGKWYDFHQ